jgi:hypothetical protein
VCTVSWVWRPEATGYDLYFNRDERRTRGPEAGPERWQQDKVTILAPSDGDHGGTWLAVNDHGLTVCLLNGYVESRGPTPEAWRSRGLLVRELADAKDAATVTARLSRDDLAMYPPFVVLALGPRAPAQLARWDGLEVTVERDADHARPLASSGHDQAVAQRARAARYAELRAEHGREDGALLERFLSDHGQGPSAFTPCMHREDSETRSQCRVMVRGDVVELVHVPGAPCRTRPGPAQHLSRQASGVRA